MPKDLPEVLDIASLTEEQQERVESCVDLVERELKRGDYRTAGVAIWDTISIFLRDNLKARLESLSAKPGDLILVKMDTERLSGGTELHQFAERLRDLIPDSGGIIMLQNEAEIQALDEEQMARLGWRKAEDSNPTLDGPTG